MMEAVFGGANRQQAATGRGVVVAGLDSGQSEQDRWHYGTGVLSLAEIVWRPEARPGQAAQITGA